MFCASPIKLLPCLIAHYFDPRFPRDRGEGRDDELAKDLCIDARAFASLSEIMHA